MSSQLVEFCRFVLHNDKNKGKNLQTVVTNPGQYYQGSEKANHDNITEDIYTKNL